jgi:hypothetical protein
MSGPPRRQCQLIKECGATCVPDLPVRSHTNIGAEKYKIMPVATDVSSSVTYHHLNRRDKLCTANSLRIGVFRDVRHAMLAASKRSS